MLFKSSQHEIYDQGMNIAFIYNTKLDKMVCLHAETTWVSFSNALLNKDKIHQSASLLLSCDEYISQSV